MPVTILPPGVVGCDTPASEPNVRQNAPGLEVQNSGSPWHVDVSVNGGTPKSSILIGFSIINHPKITIFGNIHVCALFVTCGISCVL